MEMLLCLQGAKDMYSNPETAARVQAQLIEAASELKQESDIDIGLRELAKAAKNPKMLADAMEMLKDPEIAKEVIIFKSLPFKK